MKAWLRSTAAGAGQPESAELAGGPEEGGPGASVLCAEPVNPDLRDESLAREPAPGPDALGRALLAERSMRWQRNLACAEVERLRRQLREADAAHEELEQRRMALVDSLADTLPDVMLTARMRGWDEGWAAAREGFPARANPLREAARRSTRTPYEDPEALPRPTYRGAEASVPGEPAPHEESAAAAGGQPAEGHPSGSC